MLIFSFLSNYELRVAVACMERRGLVFRRRLLCVCVRRIRLLRHPLPLLWTSMLLLSNDLLLREFPLLASYGLLQRRWVRPRLARRRRRVFRSIRSIQRLRGFQGRRILVLLLLLCSGPRSFPPSTLREFPRRLCLGWALRFLSLTSILRSSLLPKVHLFYRSSGLYCDGLARVLRPKILCFRLQRLRLLFPKGAFRRGSRDVGLLRLSSIPLPRLRSNNISRR